MALLISAAPTNLLSCITPEITPEAKPKTNDLIRVVGNRCGCGGSFCQNCGKLAVRRGLRKMVPMDWERVRCLEITVDRKKFKNPREAVKALQKEVGYLIDELRIQGIKIGRWVRFLEWHEDGFPHYHVYAEVEKSGRQGMIGYALLQSLWKHGLVREKQVESEAHWKNLLGYAGKTGYLHKAKRHQVVYPEWLLDSSDRLRRVSSNITKGVASITIAQADKILDKLAAECKVRVPISREERGKGSNRGKTNRQLVAECGSTIKVSYASTMSNIIHRGTANLSFREWRASGAKYIEGLGWCREMTREQALEFDAQYFSDTPEARAVSMTEWQRVWGSFTDFRHHKEALAKARRGDRTGGRKRGG